MNWNTTLLAPEAHLSNQPAAAIRIYPFYQYAVYTGLGLVGGATGTAAAIGLVAVIQASLVPDTVFWPNVLLLAVAATLLGWAASWLLGAIAHWTIPSFARREVAPYSLPVSLIAGTLVSLIQTYLFMAVL